MISQTVIRSRRKVMISGARDPQCDTVSPAYCPRIQGYLPPRYITTEAVVGLVCGTAVAISYNAPQAVDVQVPSYVVLYYVVLYCAAAFHLWKVDVNGHRAGGLAYYIISDVVNLIQGSSFQSVLPCWTSLITRHPTHTHSTLEGCRWPGLQYSTVHCKHHTQPCPIIRPGPRRVRARPAHLVGGSSFLRLGHCTPALERHHPQHVRGSGTTDQRAVQFAHFTICHHSATLRRGRSPTGSAGCSGCSIQTVRPLCRQRFAYNHKCPSFHLCK
jgi:hypothetical protein